LSSKNEAAAPLDVWVLYWRPTVPGTVDKRCQLQTATAKFSLLSSRWYLLCVH